MEMKLGESQFTNIHLDGLEALREGGAFQSAPKWVCSDTTILKITPDEDGCSCRIEAARPLLCGAATVTVTDRDDSSVPPVIFNITVTKEPITSLGVTIDPATEIGAEPRPTPRQHTPLPEGAVQRDPNTGEIRRETDADTGSKTPGGDPKTPADPFTQHEPDQPKP